MTISNLPNRSNLFTQKDFCIYVLDDYSVHLMPEVMSALLKRGYVYVGIGGEVTGDIQINDTDMHAPLKRKYRQLEQELMIKQLEQDPKKIPQPSRDDMMKLLVESVNSLEVDFQSSYKALWLTSALDGSVDYLVRESIMSLVGDDLKKFRSELMTTITQTKIKDLIKSITPPKGVKRKTAVEGTAATDEGEELLDCEGDKIFEGDVESDDGEPESEDEPTNDATIREEEERVETINTETSPSIIKLAPFCKSAELKKDAEFVDELAVLLLKHNSTSVRINAPVVNIKKQYRNARRNVKDRIKTEKH